MSAPELRPSCRLAAVAVLTWMILQPAPARAQAASPVPAATVAAPAPVCALLTKQLRWHEPFFGLHTWQEVAYEALAHATPACRTAITAGQAPEVAQALHDLLRQATTGGAPLRWFSDRLVCTLQVPEARPQILAGVVQPATYAECADALFAMQWSEPEAHKLRERYLAGLVQEPLRTHLPRVLLQPPYVDRLAPVLRAYELAQRPGRDALYRALCGQPTRSQTSASCAGPAEREPEWIAHKLLNRDLDVGFGQLAAFPAERLPQFSWLLRKFHKEQRSGRDRLYGMLCLRYPPTSAELAATCQDLVPRQEALWAARNHAQYLRSERESYNQGGRLLAGGFFGIALLLLVQAVLAARQRRLPRS